MDASTASDSVTYKPGVGGRGFESHFVQCALFAFFIVVSFFLRLPSPSGFCHFYERFPSFWPDRNRGWWGYGDHIQDRKSNPLVRAGSLYIGTRGGLCMYYVSYHKPPIKLTKDQKPLGEGRPRKKETTIKNAKRAHCAKWESNPRPPTPGL